MITAVWRLQVRIATWPALKRQLIILEMKESINVFSADTNDHRLDRAATTFVIFLTVRV